MTRVLALGGAVAALAVFMTVAAGPAAGDPNSYPVPGKFASGPVLSGAAEFRDVNYGTNITECPQARLDKYGPLPADRRVLDPVEVYSDGGDDRRTNEEYHCFPQDETSIDTNPVLPKNLVAGANDYRLGFGSSGVYASTDNGQKWYGSITPFPSIPGARDHLDGGGDPAIVFDRAGVAYYAQIRFMRENDSNGIFVNRSTNGGFTWSRPCVEIRTTPEPATDPGRCGGAGDPRQPGDGRVTFFDDPDGMLNGSAPFDDKEYIAAGPRPAGVEPVSFRPFTGAPFPTPAAILGVDRIYVTWTRFEDNPAALFGFTANVMISFSDDQGRSWSPARPISGSAPFCGFSTPAGGCDLNQFSTPTVHPETGLLGVAFENFNTPDENQYLFVRSRDGGVTFEGPFFITPVFDVNFPTSGAAGGRPDCGQRGQGGGRIVYTNSCFRSNAGGNVVIDKRGGAFADDFYLVMSDNRNGTRVSTNADIFLFKSTDAGTTWIGPNRVNNDPSGTPADFECPREGPSACPPGVHTGNDQWWPWVDINNKGHLNVAFKDRRLDLDSVAHEWATSRQRPGNYLVWTWGAQCTIESTALVTQETTAIPSGATDCLAPGAAVIPTPTGLINPSGIVPGQGPLFLAPYHNFGISDFPSNFDYCFRAGIFCGDYDVVATVDDDTKVYSHFTDARNGRSSRNQAGRNPACEQSDVMVDEYSSTSADAGQKQPKPEDAMFLQTDCPADSGEFRR